MPDIGHEETDKILARMERKVRKVYGQAYSEMSQKAQEYFKWYEKEDARRREMVATGALTAAEYRQWRLSHFLSGKRWWKFSSTLAEDLLNANQIAASIINGYLPEVYAVNMNWSTYQIEKTTLIDTSFVLYDRPTVERLLRDGPDLLPWQATVSKPEDIRYNRKKLNSAVTQGIIQGESIPEIADRLARTTGMTARNAITNARTMTTSAENGGRMDSYDRAQKLGIMTDRQWLATLDFRTRHEHRVLDRQIAKMGEPFMVEGEEIYFPGDPKAAPHLVYNCRCTLRAIVLGYEYDEYSHNGKLGNMSYEDWKADRGQSPQSRMAKNRARDEKQFEEYKELLKGQRGAMPRKFADFQQMKYTDPEGWGKVLQRTREARKGANNGL